MGDVRLVREALAEAEQLVGFVAPHLVRRRRFLLPVYDGGPYGRTAVRGALGLYRVLSGSRVANAFVPGDIAASLVPSLRLDGLREAGVYSDAQTNDARLCLANVRAAADAGAAVANYVEVVRDRVRPGVDEGGGRRPDLRRPPRARGAHPRQRRRPVGGRDPTAGRPLGRHLRDSEQGRASRGRGAAGVARGRHDPDRRVAACRSRCPGRARSCSGRPTSCMWPIPTTSRPPTTTNSGSSPRRAGRSTPRFCVRTGSSDGSPACACSRSPAGEPRPRGERPRSSASRAGWSPWPAAS